MCSQLPQGELAAKYWAFISYSSKDRPHGTWLIQALETYRIPPSLVGRKTKRGPVPQRLVPVFRDRDELRSSPNLEAALETALLQSRNLIVICSPNSARSDSWVNKEIIKFKAAGRHKFVHAMIVAGVPHGSDQPGNEDQECLPQALRYEVDATGHITDERTEPLAADLLREDPRPRVSRRMAFLKLVAGIIDVDFDELWGRDRQRRRRRMLATGAAALASLLVLFGLTMTGLNATRAELSSRLAQQATVAVRDQPDTALLLAVAAYNTSPTAAAYGSLLAAVDATTHLVTSFHDLADVSALALGNDGQSLAVAGCEEPACTDSTILVYDVVTGRLSHSPIELNEGQVADLTFESSTGHLWAVLSSADNHRLVSLDLTQPSPTPEQIFRTNRAITVAITADGSLYAVNTGSPASRTSEFKLFPTGAGRRCGDIWDAPVAVMAFSPSGDQLLVGPGYVVDTADCASQQIFSCQTQDAAFDGAGYLLTIMPDSWADQWDLTQTPPRSRPLDLIGVSVNGYLHKFSPQASYLASRDGSDVLISDVATRREILELLAEEEENPIQAAYLRSELSSLQPVRLKGHAGEPTRFRFSSDQRYLATADDQGEVLVWDVQGSPLIEPAVPSENEEESLEPDPGAQGQDAQAIGPDGRITATVSQQSLGCEDAILSPGCTLTTRLTLRNRETGEVVGSLETTARQAPQRENLVNTFTSDGDLLTFATDFSDELSGYIVWHINPKALVERACQRANRPLQSEELATQGLVQGWRSWLVGTACADE